MFRNIVVGLSGGVDSAVSTILLKRKGFNVTAVFLRNWDTADETGKCLADEDYKDAEFICKKLDVPLVEVNFVKEYWNDVFSYLVGGYQDGLTPNPDVICNRNIKFNKFYNYARNNLKADAIATGHYARTSFGSFLEYYSPDKRVKLLKARDSLKDQTLFLAQVNQEPLRRCMFPIADYMKKDIKQIAIDEGLDRIAAKDESMGICFIGTRTFQNFITEYIEDKPGDFVDCETGKVVGKHRGIHHWTIGQRCRISGLSKAYFVYRKDVNSNTIYVASGHDHPALYTQTVITSKPHWICEEPPELLNSNGVLHCDFKFQHIENYTPCTVYKTVNEQLIIILDEPKRAVSPGQFAVLFVGDECVGSAPIINPGPSFFSLGKSFPDIESNDKVAVHNM
ncbi:mitochondrial tRNA-specific 2-thiouridylase 1 isoform X1 [Microplitis mediator]|uniref:mitochondrial tRNA-specific 2-thiouridylase 1 isoform X1 n=1 Tax=Microplitis mediator TaxID=375433 RepID=UPI002557A8E6|nr:mitochondrial tRNA-specific 2-thiouridylase 1 isoform X1 [Microplitis mediator]